MEWKISDSPVDYEEAVAWMDARARAIRAGQADECIWLLEHPPLYTAGSSARQEDLLEARFPVHQTGRGGQYTYHGPGQLIAYVMLDLKKRYAPKVPDVRDFVRRLEEWIIRTLAHFGVHGERREGRVGIWVSIPSRSLTPVSALRATPNMPSTSLSAIGGEGWGEGEREAKIAAVGVRISQGITTHGIAINLNPDLSHYAGIIPCGIREHGVTSLAAQGVVTNPAELRQAVMERFNEIFSV